MSNTVNQVFDGDTSTFEGYLRYQGIDPTTCSPEGLIEWRAIFNDAMRQKAQTPPVGFMKLRSLPGQQLYAVAIDDGPNLWLTMWIRCGLGGDVYILYPRADRKLNAHASYHRNGRFHQKSDDRVLEITVQKRQSLTGNFRGREHLGAYGGHGGASIGAICNPSSFTGIVRIEPGRLGA